MAKNVSQGSGAVESLLSKNFEFRRLQEEHEVMERKLKKLDGLRYRSVEEEKERKHIQKMKLWGKDRMYEIIRTAKQRSLST